MPEPPGTYDTGNKSTIVTNGKKYDKKKLISDKYNNTWAGLPNPTELNKIKSHGFYSPPKKARDLYELSNPDVQCNGTIGKSEEGDECYICDIILGNWKNAGYETKPNGKTPEKNVTKFTQTGRQCEHVIPILVMALTCGLYSGNYMEYIRNYFAKIGSTNKKNLMKEYIDWQELCWELGYLWSHTECNMVKNEFPFIDIKIDIANTKKPITILKIDDDSRAGRNLDTFFQQLLQKDNSWTNMYRRWYNPVIWDELDTDEVGMDTDEWIKAKKEKLITKHLEPLREAIVEGQESNYFLYSIGILKDVIVRKLGSQKLLKSGTVISKLFRFSQGGGAKKKKKSNKKNKTKKKTKKKKKKTKKKYKIRSGMNPEEIRAMVTTILNDKEIKEDIQEDAEIRAMVAAILQDKEIKEDIVAAVTILGMNNKDQILYDNITVGQAIRMLEGRDDTTREFDVVIKNIITTYKELLLENEYEPAIVESYLEDIKDIAESLCELSSDISLPEPSSESEEEEEGTTVVNVYDVDEAPSSERDVGLHTERLNRIKEEEKAAEKIYYKFLAEEIPGEIERLLKGGTVTSLDELETDVREERLQENTSAAEAVEADKLRSGSKKKKTKKKKKRKSKKKKKKKKKSSFSFLSIF